MRIPVLGFVISVEGNGFERNGSPPFGVRQSRVGLRGISTKVAEKNAFSDPDRKQLKPLSRFSRKKISAKSAGFCLPEPPGKYDAPSLAGGARGI